MILLASGIFTAIMSSTSSIRGIPASLMDNERGGEGGSVTQTKAAYYNSLASTNGADDHYPSVHTGIVMTKGYIYASGLLW